MRNRVKVASSVGNQKENDPRTKAICEMLIEIDLFVLSLALIKVRIEKSNASRKFGH